MKLMTTVVPVVISITQGLLTKYGYEPTQPGLYSSSSYLSLYLYLLFVV